MSRWDISSLIKSDEALKMVSPNLNLKKGRDLLTSFNPSSQLPGWTFLTWNHLLESLEEATWNTVAFLNTTNLINYTNYLDKAYQALSNIYSVID